MMEVNNGAAFASVGVVDADLSAKVAGDPVVLR
jgi:hypothetical protein